ncbi:MAG: DUF4271 domain-containing protein [Bacteroidales bacterium]|nr:DUF4271 domain-containing protein [Bacteroidales bacterium]
MQESHFYFESYTVAPQSPDSTQQNNPFAGENKPVDFFNNQPSSILSTDFDHHQIDSIVKVKTRRLSVKKPKEIKARSFNDSYLLLKKDTLAMIQSFQNKAFKLWDIKGFIYTPVPNFITETKSELAVEDSVSLVNSILVEDTLPVLAPIDSLAFNAVEEVSVKPKIAPRKVVKESDSTQWIQSVPSKQEEVTLVSDKHLSGSFWLISMVLSMLFLLAFVRLYFGHKFKIFWQAFFSYQHFYKIYKEQNVVQVKFDTLLSVLYYLNISLVGFYTSYFFKMAIDAYFLWFSLILSAFLAYNFAYYSSNKILAFFFETGELIDEYLYNVYYNNRLLGVVLMPLVVLFPFVDLNAQQYILGAIFFIISFSFIYRWFRGLQISFKARVPYFYMILYLCTLEIVPIMLVYKLIF